MARPKKALPEPSPEVQALQPESVKVVEAKIPVKPKETSAQPQNPMKLTDLKGITVSRVALHQAFDMPVAGMSNTFSEARQAGIKLCYTPSGVTWEYKGKTGIIPLANVIGAYE